MSGSNAPLISVIVVNFNSGSRLSRCLQCLSAQEFRNFDVIVVDNGSTDDSLQLARGAGCPFTFIDAGENIGFAAANNKAARSAQGEWIALLNPGRLS